MNILDLKRKLLPMSGPQGGGSSSSGTPATQTQIKDLPDWAKGYAKNTLERTAALTDQPYQAYQGDRIAGFDPMQLGAQQGAANMTTSGLTGQAADLSGQVAQRGMNTQNFGADQASQYMNPYQQNVTDIQKREAQRQSGIQGVQQQAQAAGAGALGGSRDAIMRAERERNLGTQMNDIQAQGSNAAYTNAQNQFNADQARGMQGLNTAGAAASQMGTLGGQQFQQGMDINKLQAGYGAQQQALQQQGLTQGYQDFLNQKQAPYTQLGYMSNMINGLPIGGVSTTTSDQGSPSTAQTLGAAGTAAYGLSKFMADGGSVESQGNIESIVKKLSDQQLTQAEQSAKARGDMEEMQVIAMEKATRASMKNGLASIPTDMNKMMPTQESMARGGIVAFAGDKNSLVQGDDAAVGTDADLAAGENPDLTPITPDMGAQPSSGYNPYASPSSDMGVNATAAEATPVSKTPMTKKDAAQIFVDKLLADRDKEEVPYVPKTAAEQAEMTAANLKALKEAAGPSQYAEERANIKQMSADNAKNLEQGKGLAALQAASAMLQGNNAIRGLAAGASKFGESYEGISRAAQAEKRALESMRINLADAERKENMGMHRDAAAATAAAMKDQQAALQFRKDDSYRKHTTDIALATMLRQRNEPIPNFDIQTLTANVANRMGVEKPKPGETPEQMANRISAEEANKIQVTKQQKFGINDIGATRLGVETAKLGQTADLKREGEAAVLRKSIADAVDTDKTTRKLSTEEKSVITEQLVNKALKAQAATAAEIPRPGAPKVDTPAPAAVAPKVGTPAPAAVAPIPLPANPTPAMLVNGKVYLTGRGPATWNAAIGKFAPVSQ